jgi:hypothetical protein
MELLLCTLGSEQLVFGPYVSPVPELDAVVVKYCGSLDEVDGVKYVALCDGAVTAFIDTVPCTAWTVSADGESVSDHSANVAELWVSEATSAEAAKTAAHNIDMRPFMIAPASA